MRQHAFEMPNVSCSNHTTAAAQGREENTRPHLPLRLVSFLLLGLRSSANYGLWTAVVLPGRGSPLTKSSAVATALSNPLRFKEVAVSVAHFGLVAMPDTVPCHEKQFLGVIQKALADSENEAQLQISVMNARNLLRDVVVD